jgi:hypothetical protein
MGCINFVEREGKKKEMNSDVKPAHHHVKSAEIF